MKRDNFYEEADKLYQAMSVLPDEKHKELCEILGYTYTPELFDDLTLAIFALEGLLKTYREITEARV